MAYDKFKIEHLPQISAEQINNSLAVLECDTSYKCQITNTSAAIDAGNYNNYPVIVDAKAIKDYINAQQYIPTANITDLSLDILNKRRNYIPTCSAVYDYINSVSSTNSADINTSKHKLTDGKAVHDYITYLSGYLSTNIDDNNQKFVTGNAVYDYIINLSGYPSTSIAEGSQQFVTGNAIYAYLNTYMYSNLIYKLYNLNVETPGTHNMLTWVDIRDNYEIWITINASDPTSSFISGHYNDTFNIAYSSEGIEILSNNVTFYDHRSNISTNILGNFKLIFFNYDHIGQLYNVLYDSLASTDRQAFQANSNYSDSAEISYNIYYDIPEGGVHLLSLAGNKTCYINCNETYHDNATHLGSWTLAISWSVPAE